MSEFAGFADGAGPLIPVPDAFFSVVLPQIESISELKITMHLIWLLSRRRGLPRAVSLSELEADRLLLRSLKPGPGPRPVEDYLREGLELAVTRGTVLLLEVSSAKLPLSRWYLLNSPTSRAALESIGQEQLDPSEVVGPETGPIEVVRIYRPNIFTLYERNIGVLTPLIGDQLRAAELEYPPDWIAEAMRLAVEYNKRNWAYVAGILKRWEAEGKGNGANRHNPEQTGDPERYTSGRYGHLVES